MPDVVISTRPHGGDWTVLGRGHNAPGCTPDGVTMSAGESGPDQLGFTIRRPTGGPWDDLQPFCAVRAEVPGAGTVWSGRVTQVVPGENGAISVTCKGHMDATEDQMWRRTWIRNRLAGFQDIRRSSTGALNLAIFDPSSDYLAEVDGAIHLALPARTVTLNTVVAVLLDMGEAVAESVSVDYVNLGTTHAAVSFAIQGYDDAACTTGGVNAYGPTASHLMTAPAATVTGDFASPKRYVLLAAIVNTGTTLGATWNMRITGVRVFGDPAYRSGGASAVLASTVLEEVAGALTWLNSDTSRIEATVTTIPHLDTEGQYETHGQTMQRVNAYHAYLMGVDVEQRLFFRQRPSTPLIAIGQRSGDNAFQDAGDTTDELFNEVLVNGTDPAGAQVQELVTQTSGPLARAGVTRTRVLEVGASTTTVDAAVIGAAWLQRRATKPTRGSIQLRGPGAAWWAETGVPVQPAQCLRLPGELIRIGDRGNPDTGGVGREAVIKAVSYDPQSDTATLTLDSASDYLDALLARVGVSASVRPPL